jgi:hypothetical protein
MKIFLAISLGLFCLMSAGAAGSAQTTSRAALAKRLDSLLVPGAFTDYAAATAPVQRKINPRIAYPEVPISFYHVERRCPRQWRQQQFHWRRHE